MKKGPTFSMSLLKARIPRSLATAGKRAFVLLLTVIMYQNGQIRDSSALLSGDKILN